MSEVLDGGYERVTDDETGLIGRAPAFRDVLMKLPKVAA
jgi:hypothetical protein